MYFTTLSHHKCIFDVYLHFIICMPRHVRVMLAALWNINSACYVGTMYEDGNLLCLQSVHVCGVNSMLFLFMC